MFLSSSLSLKLRPDKENHAHILLKGQVLLSVTAEYLNIDLDPNGSLLSDYPMIKNGNNFSLSIVNELQKITLEQEKCC